jgi:hypothetical protein
MTDRYRNEHAPAAPTWTPIPPTITGERAKEIDALTRTSVRTSLIRQLAKLVDVPASNADNVILEAIKNLEKTP